MLYQQCVRVVRFQPPLHRQVFNASRVNLAILACPEYLRALGFVELVVTTLLVVARRSKARPHQP